MAITPEQINPNDVIVFEINGWTHGGRVISAHNYGTQENPNWYIEWTNKLTGKFGHWKQAEDGGALVEHYPDEGPPDDEPNWDDEADLRAAESGALLEEKYDRAASSDDPRSF